MQLKAKRTIKSSPARHGRKILFSVCVVILSLVVLFALGEVGIRGWRLYQQATRSDGIRFKPFSAIYIDDVLGWGTTENFHSEYWEKDAADNKYFVRYKTVRHGFRKFGDVYSKKAKILILGDSFTNGAQVSNDKTYYGILKRQLPVEIFAYGGSGFGTLQEYMILDRYIDEIKPSLIIWQYCGNDFINNSYELERLSYVNNNGMRRPYLTQDGQVVYWVPKAFPLLRYVAHEYSEFLYFIVSRLDRLTARISKTNWAGSIRPRTVEESISEQGQKHPGFQRSALITASLIGMIRKRSGKTPILAFSVDDASPYYDEFQKISTLNEIMFIDGIPQAVRHAEERGLITKASDKAHWNETGHKIVGEKIVDYLKSHAML